MKYSQKSEPTHSLTAARLRFAFIACFCMLLSLSVSHSAERILPTIQFLLTEDSTSVPVINGVLVDNDAQLQAALNDPQQNSIVLAPGNYTLVDMVKGQDRSANPLTIQGQYPDRKPVFLNATQSIELTRSVTLKNLKFVNDGGLGSNDFWIYDAGGGSENGDARDIVLDGLEFYSPAPSSLTDLSPNPAYGEGMARLMRFSNYRTHNYEIRNIVAQYAYTVGDFRMNGNVTIDGVVVDKWYFDGIRILGQGSEGYVDGNRIIANVDLTDNIAVYEEIDGDSTPHPDNTQKFNSGSTLNNTDPLVSNTLFYHNRFNPGQLRSGNTQSGLSQTYENNVGYIENIYGTKLSPHGISLEGGGNGVLIERNTLVDVNWASSPWLRIFRSDGEIAVYDSYFPAGVRLGSGNNVNRQGYELVAQGNNSTSSYESFFQGPVGLTGIAGLVQMFSPKTPSSVGALTASGQWRNLPHRPMMADSPALLAGERQFQLLEPKSPTLWSPDQPRLGAAKCDRFNLRWSPSNTFSWTALNNVSAGDVFTSIPSGLIDVQTQCVNSAGNGLWSKVTVVEIAPSF